MHVSPRYVQFWWPAVDGAYSTKSGYWLGRIGHLQGWMDRFGGDNGEIWRTVWNVEGQPKLHHFIWRACTGSLATEGRLKDRHILDDGRCTHCEMEDESITHAILRCSLVSSIWENSPSIHYVRDGPSSSFMDFFVWLRSRLEKQDLLSLISWPSHGRLGRTETLSPLMNHGEMCQ